MSPDKKLKWFSEHGYNDVEVNKIREMTRRRWAQDYKSPTQAVNTPSGAGVASSASTQVRKNEVMLPRSTDFWSKHHCSPWDDDDEALELFGENVDDIDVYFDEPVVPKMSVRTAGGAMKWWYAQESLRPSVALMAMDFISAPGGFFNSHTLSTFSNDHFSILNLEWAPVLNWTTLNELDATRHVARRASRTHVFGLVGWYPTFPEIWDCCWNHRAEVGVG
jgi:hypothetical protein